MRNYLTFMSGSDSQQFAYIATLFREAAHEWYISYERRNRGPPRDWASLAAALLDRFGSNIRSQEAQSQLMSISQGQRSVRDYASQFETLLGRLDSYDEGLMLNQFIWDCSQICKSTLSQINLTSSFVGRNHGTCCKGVKKAQVERKYCW